MMLLKNGTSFLVGHSMEVWEKDSLMLCTISEEIELEHWSQASFCVCLGMVTAGLEDKAIDIKEDP